MLLRTYYDSCSLLTQLFTHPRALLLQTFLHCVNEKAVRQKGFLFYLLREHSFKRRLVGTSEFGHCKTQTLYCILQTEGKIHTADIVITESHFIES